jgi:hypothetical protein
LAAPKNIQSIKFHRRGSPTQILARKAKRKAERKEIRRREYRQGKKGSVELAKTPAKPNLAQERILAEEQYSLYSHSQQQTDRPDFQTPTHNNLKLLHTDPRIATFNLKGMT